MLSRYAARASLLGNSTHQAQFLGAVRRFSPLPHTSKVMMPLPPIRVRRVSTLEPQQSAVDKMLDFGRELLFKRAKLYLAMALGGALFLGTFWYQESEGCITNEMRNVFESGGAPGWNGVGRGHDMLLERPALMADLHALFMPGINEHLYHVIIGNEGTGKTTAIRGALLSLASPKAVVYCNVGSAKSFVVDLAKAVGYRPSFSVRARIWRWIEGEKINTPTVTWVKLKSKLDEVAKITSKPLVIVLDSADRLFEEDPAFFSELQRDAKDAADNGSPIYVFVLTKGRGLALLRSHSEWSRAALPFEVRDVADDEAVKLLRAKHKHMQPEEAEEAVRTITGGRFHLLYSFPAPSSKTIEVYRSQKFDATKAALNTIGLSYTHPFFARLSSSTSILGSTATAQLEEGQLSKLLEKNILSVRADGSYAFNSRHVESFFAGVFSKVPEQELNILLKSGAKGLEYKATDFFVSLPDTATMEEVLRAVAKEEGYTEEEVRQDLEVLRLQRVRTVHHVRVLSEQDIKDLGLPPVVARYILRIQAGGDQ